MKTILAIQLVHVVTELWALLAVAEKSLHTTTPSDEKYEDPAHEDPQLTAVIVGPPVSIPKVTGRGSPGSTDPFALKADTWTDLNSPTE